MLAYLPANPKEDDRQSDMFENLFSRSIEHFACAVLMDMKKEMFDCLEKIKPDAIDTEARIQAAADTINQLMVKNLVPNDIDFDEQVLLRMSSVNLEDPSDVRVVKMLRESVNQVLKSTISTYRYSRPRLRKLEKDFNKIYTKEAANIALAQLADMISGIV